MEKEEKRTNLLTAILVLVLGVLLVIFRKECLAWAITIAGAFAIVFGVIDLFKKEWLSAIIKAVIGIAAILCAWLITDVAVFVLAAILVIYGAYEIFNIIKAKNYPKDFWKKFLMFLAPAIKIVAGILLFFGTDILFLIVGIILIIDAIAFLYNTLK